MHNYCDIQVTISCIGIHVFKESPKSLVRSKKTRRSNSFSDVARSSSPVSLMIDAVSDSRGNACREEYCAVCLEKDNSICLCICVFMVV